MAGLAALVAGAAEAARGRLQAVTELIDHPTAPIPPATPIHARVA